MDYESSDILGRHTLPGAPISGGSRWPSFYSSFKLASVVVLIIFGYAAFLQAWDALLKWQERSHRLYVPPKFSFIYIKLDANVFSHCRSGR